MIGEKFGKLKVLSENNKRTKSREKRYNCLCDCGKEVVVRGSSLKSGTKSCGCIRIEMLTKRATSHGFCGHELHHKWNSMRYRCLNENTKRYFRYGGRGIKVCPEWETDFETFYKWAITAGWQPGLTIDRIDNNGDYTPENCRFVSIAQNNRNMGHSAYYIVWGKVFDSAQQAAKRFNVTRSTIHRWCAGYKTACGNYSPPKQLCYKVNKYND